MNSALSKDAIIKSNQLILENIKNLQKRIADLQQHKSTESDAGPSSDSNDSEEEVHEAFDNARDLESVYDMKQRLQATEQLNGIKFKNYTCKDITSHDGLPPGRWQEVNIDVVINGWFKASISFVENSKNNKGRVISLKWSVDGRLARSELAPLVKYVQNDVPGLFARLKDYSNLANDRSELLEEFSSVYGDNFQIQQMESGVLLEWEGNLFQIMWSLRLCEYSEAIVDFFDIEVNQKERDFVRASNKLFSELLLVRQTIEGRRNALMELAKCAIVYQSQLSSKPYM
ncbi:uncharacterized protein LOC143914524 [Arctopsyche grandis]|uniref:uncharacterized protein LOC143914524 n=1 Tax=Arctopsyche grandis TaxID=121162 RepID=UPI00406D6362